MKFQTPLIGALLMAATGFVMTGGVQAMALAVEAEEASSAPSGQETSIPFANMGGLRDWQAVDDQTLYVQDNQRSWYIARLAAPCAELPFASAIGFETKGINRLDRFAAVVVSGTRCPFSSFVASGPPPAKPTGGRR